MEIDSYPQNTSQPIEVDSSVINESTPLTDPYLSHIQQKKPWWLDLRKIKSHIPYYIPILGWLPKYSIKENLWGDTVAGIAVSALLIPQCLAYAVLAGLPPVYGLYTSWVKLNCDRSHCHFFSFF
jgi:hypothetical protein